jgi:hypothetical protein
MLMVIAALGAAAGAPAASAGVSFGAYSILQSAGGVTLTDAHPKVAADARGDAVVVWDANDHLLASTRNGIGGTWSTPVQISPNGSYTEGYSVAMTAAGLAIVADHEGTSIELNDTGTISVEAHQLGAQWQSVGALSAPSAFPEGDPDVATSSAGDVAIVYASRTSGFYARAVIAELPAGGSWHQYNLSNGTSTMGHVSVAFDSHREAYAAWAEYETGGDQIRTAQLDPSGNGSADDQASAGYSGMVDSSPTLAVDGAGNETVAFLYDTNGGANTMLTTIRRPAGGSWQAHVDHPFGQNRAEYPSLGVDAAGDVTMLAEDPYGVTFTPYSWRYSNGAWSAAGALSSQSNVADIGPPRLAVGPGGEAAEVFGIGPMFEGHMAGGAWMGRVITGYGRDTAVASDGPNRFVFVHASLGESPVQVVVDDATLAANPPSGCVVPKVIGKRQAVALRALHAAHCSSVHVTKRHTVKRKRGLVLSVSPKAGTRTARRVTIVVGS